MNDKDCWLAWAAGFFEGEGCISTGGKKTRHGALCLSVSNCDLSMLERFRTIVDCGTIYQERAKARDPRRKTIHAWNLWRQDEVDRTISLLWPFLSERRRERIMELRAIRAEVVAHSLRERSCPTCGCLFCPTFSNSATLKVYCSLRCRNNAPGKKRQSAESHRECQRRYMESRRAIGIV